MAALVLASLVVSPSPRDSSLAAILNAFSRAWGSTAVMGSELLMSFGVGAGIVILGIIIVLAFLDRKSGRAARPGRHSRSVRQAWIALVVLALAFTVLPQVMAAIYGSFLSGNQGEAGQTVPADPRASEDAGLAAALAGKVPSEEPRLPKDRPLLLALFAAGGALAVGGTLLFVLRPGRAKSGGMAFPILPEAPLDMEAEGAGQLESFLVARRILQTGDIVRDAVIAAYAAMCDILAPPSLAGNGDATLTAREFAALLGSRGIAETGIAVLTAKFEMARYSAEAMGEGDRSEALWALEAIEARHRAGLGGRA